MRALYDRTGHVALWLKAGQPWLIDLRGKPRLFIHGDSVYDLAGQHVGWWTGAEVWDWEGRLLLADLDSIDLGGMTPPWHPKPTPPAIGSDLPIPPMLGLHPAWQPRRLKKWADASLFLMKLVAGGSGEGPLSIRQPA